MSAHEIRYRSSHETRREERRGEGYALTHSTIFCCDTEAFKRPQLGVFADAFNLFIQDGDLATFRQHGRHRTPKRPPRRDRRLGERSVVVLIAANEGILAFTFKSAGEARAESPEGGEVPRGYEREPVRVEAERAWFRRR